MKAAQKIGWSIVSMVFFFLIIASFVLSFLDWNEYRDTLARIASEGSDVEVRLSGNVTLSLLPSPQISAETVSFLPTSEEAVRPFATAEKIDLKLSAISLLRGDISFERLDLDGLELTLAEEATGDWTIKGWPTGADTEGAGDTGDAEAPFRTLGFDSLRIENGKLTIEPQSGTVRQLVVSKLDFTGSLPKGPLNWEGTLFLDGQEVLSSGRLRPVKIRDAVSLRAEFGVDGGGLVVSGRLDPDGGITGRIEAEGDDFVHYINSLSKILVERPALTGNPVHPFRMDMQVGGNRSLLQLTARDLQVGETRGRLDLSVAQNNRSNITGSLSMGVIDQEAWAGVGLAPADPDEDEEGGSSGLSLPFVGTLDVDIEGVRNRRGLIRHVSTTLDFQEEDIGLSSFQALIPGATTLSAHGAYRSEADYLMTFSANSGNLPSLLRWLDIKTPDGVPEGRLATAKLDGILASTSGGWRLDVRDGTIDTTGFSGWATGPARRSMPDKVNLKISGLNLDAYLAGGTWADQGRKPLSERLDGLLLAEAETTFLVEARNIFWQGHRFEAVNVDMVSSRAHFALSGFQATTGQSSIKTDFDAVKTGGAWTVDAAIALNEFPAAVFPDLSEDFHRLRKAANITALDGTVSAKGPLGGLRVNADLRSGKDTLSVNGNVATDGITARSFNLQGNVKHQNLRKALALRGLALQGRVPLDVAFSVAKPQAGAPVTLRVGGKVSGGQFQADGTTLGTGGYDLKIALDHPRASRLSRLIGFGLFPDGDKQATMQVRLVKSGGGLALRDINLENESMVVTGNVTVTENEALSGDLRLTGFKVSTPKTNDAAVNRLATREIEFPWRTSVGVLKVSLDDIELFGQRLAAPSARADLGDGVLQISLGEDARLNDGRLQGKIDLMAGDIPAFHIAVDATQLDLPSLLTGSGYSPVASGKGSVKLELAGKGNTLTSMKNSLSGEGRFEGYAGTINFLSVPSIVREMQEAETATGFLRTLGGHFREGQTTVTGLNASFTMDEGVALFDALDARGDWGRLALDGQINLVDDLMALKGELNLTSPPDTPAIPVTYSGSISKPSATWKSQLFERFVIAGIERRFRSVVFQELEERQKGLEGKQQTPGIAVFGRALDLLGGLRKKQQAEKTTREKSTGDKSGQNP